MSYHLLLLSNFSFLACIFAFPLPNYKSYPGRARLANLHLLPHPVPVTWTVRRLWVWFFFLLTHHTFSGVRYGRLESKNNKWRVWYKMHRHLYAIVGVLELVLLTGLSAIGEKEHGGERHVNCLTPKEVPVVHVCMFYSFGVFALLFFISNTVCHSQSLYFLNPYVSSLASLRDCCSFPIWGVIIIWWVYGNFVKNLLSLSRAVSPTTLR